jgi:hypothetical protein
LRGEAAAALALGRLDHSRVEAAGAYELAGSLEAAGIADFGEQVADEDRADTEDGLQRLAARVGAGEAAQLALEQLELLLECRDHGGDHVDLAAHVRIELERGDPAAPPRA